MHNTNINMKVERYNIPAHPLDLLGRRGMYCYFRVLVRREGRGMDAREGVLGWLCGGLMIHPSIWGTKSKMKGCHPLQGT